MLEGPAAQAGNACEGTRVDQARNSRLITGGSPILTTLSLARIVPASRQITFFSNNATLKAAELHAPHRKPELVAEMICLENRFKRRKLIVAG